MATRNRRRPSKQQTALAQVDRFAWLLDNSIRIPGLNYRIGLDAIIGLIPGLGDVAGMILSSFIVLQAIRMGAPGGVLTRMIFNIGLEAALGLFPVWAIFLMPRSRPMCAMHSCCGTCSIPQATVARHRC
ncbi:MAG: DUF4112 domain-containing protein [Caldilineaceae bacterium]